MNPYWNSFADELSWFVGRRKIEVGRLQPPGTWRASANVARQFPTLTRLLQSFGGIIERSNEPEGSWLLNLNDALTATEATHDASFIAEASIFEQAGIAVPIDVHAYYSIAREANGNDTLCHRVNGDVLLFAQDHAFDHVVPLEGCPEYTLYRIQGAPTFDAWVEAVAAQWTSPQ